MWLALARNAKHDPSLRDEIKHYLKVLGEGDGGRGNPNMESESSESASEC